MVQFSNLATRAFNFASVYNVNLEPDITGNGSCTPILMPLDGHGRPLEHITDLTGKVDFYRSRIDYFQPNYHVAASRFISMVLPGYRIRSAFVPSSMDTRIIQVHAGVGTLIVGTPPRDGEDFSTTHFKLDSQVTPAVKIPAHCFYTLEASSWNHGPLVVSEVTETKGNSEHMNAEILLEPGQEFISTPDGVLEVPEEFVEGIFT